MGTKALGIVLVGVLGCEAAYGQAKPSDPCTVADRSFAAHLLPEARSGYEACLAAGQVTFEILSNLGAVYSQLSQFDRAIPTYRQALALNPDNPFLHLNLGLAFYKSDKVREAAVEFSRTLILDPDNLKALELLAFCHYQMNQIDLAAAEASRVERAQPEDGSAMLLLGTCLLRLGQYKQAIQLLYLATLKADLPQTHLLLGEALLGVKAFKSAMREFTGVLAASPDTPGLTDDLGIAYAGLGQPDKAIEEFQKQLAADPNDFQANYYLGRLKRLNNEPDAAKQFLAKAEQLRTGDPSVGYEYAVFAIQDKDYAKAEGLLSDILNRVPNYTDAHVLLAEVYYKLHRPDDAKRERAIIEALKKEEQEEENAGGKPPESPAPQSPGPQAPGRPAVAKPADP